MDAMLSGGYFRGNSVLISGSPGTAKSTLAAAFTDASCRCGERALYVSFDESPEEMVRNFSSVGIALGRHLRKRLLVMHGVRAASRSAEEHLLLISSLLDSYQPRALVIDPLSALTRAGGAVSAFGVAQRLSSSCLRNLHH